MGFRTEKGFVMDGSVDAVKASGVGGVTFLAINPAALWGREGDSGGKGGAVCPGQSEGDGTGSIFVVLRGETPEPKCSCYR